MRVLIIEDEKKIAKLIQRALKEELFSVDVANDGEEGLYLLQTNSYDAAIIDWMLPKISGLEIVKEIRKENIFTPVLMLTAKGDLEDKIVGLESGADDYLAKPFSFGELLARVKALIRRANYKENVLKIGKLQLNQIKREVKCEDFEIELTPKEFEILEFLLLNKNQTITTTTLLEHIWGMDDMIQSNVVNVTIYHLRKKLFKACKNEFIKTVRGRGYKIDEG